MLEAMRANCQQPLPCIRLAAQHYLMVAYSMISVMRTAKGRFLLAALSITYLQAGTALADVTYATRRPTFVLYGDSITQFGFDAPNGWAAQLAALYSRKADIINRGMAGYNARWGALALPETLSELTPAKVPGRPGQFPFNPRVQLVTIWFGANDAVLPNGKDGRISVPVSDYQAAISTMVQQAKDAGVPHILVMTAPPVDEAAHSKRFNLSFSDRTNQQLSKYAAAAKAAADSKGVGCLDMFTLFSKLPADRYHSMLLDGVHMNADGQTFVFEAVKNVLENWEGFKKLRSDSLPYQWPPWNMVDEEKPAATFKELLDKKLVTVRE